MGIWAFICIRNLSSGLILNLIVKVFSKHKARFSIGGGLDILTVWDINNSHEGLINILVNSSNGLFMDHINMLY